MEKLAQICNSEVRGVLAALVDTGHIKVASAEDFDQLSDAVQASLPSLEYDIDDIVKIAADLLEGEEKTASYNDVYNENMAALGELLLMKTAGQISDAEFAEVGEYLVKSAGLGSAIAGVARSAGQKIKAAPGQIATGARFTGQKIKAAPGQVAAGARKLKAKVKMPANLGKALRRAAAPTAAAAGMGAAGYGGYAYGRRQNEE